MLHLGLQSIVLILQFINHDLDFRAYARAQALLQRKNLVLDGLNLLFELPGDLCKTPSIDKGITTSLHPLVELNHTVLCLIFEVVNRGPKTSLFLLTVFQLFLHTAEVLTQLLQLRIFNSLASHLIVLTTLLSKLLDLGLRVGLVQLKAFDALDEIKELVCIYARLFGIRR